MNLQSILDKIARGEELTDDEKAFLKEYNLQKTLDDAAAAARRKAEERAQAAEAAKDEAETKAREAQEALDAKEQEGKTDHEKLQAENERLKALVAERDAQIEALSKDKEGLTRDAKLGQIIAGSGIVFIDGVDGEAMTELLKGRFGDLDLDALDDDTQTNPILEAFKTGNEAIIADTSGHGSGGDHKGKLIFRGNPITNPWKKDTRNLTLQGQITKEDPELAARLKKEAGVA
jgi:hypothetical protein